MGWIARAIAAAASLGVAGATLVACSSSDVMRPDIDVTNTAALAPPAPVYVAPAPDLVEPAPAVMQSYPVEAEAPPAPVESVAMAAPPVSVPAAPATIAPPPPVQAAITPAPGLRRLVPSNPYMNQPPDYRAPQRSPAVMPQSEVDCRRALKRIGATWRDMPAVGDGRSCGIDFPVQLVQLSGDIAIKPAALLSCQMALQVAKWTKNELGPSTRRRYFTGVKAIHQGSSYSCRNIRGSRTMSEHSKGNALDIMRIELDSGRDIGVRKPGFFAFREKGLLNNVRADACDYFSTVLGPGYDRDHKDHFHFDIAQRRNGHKACR
jgi:hypothetical protein